MPSWIRIRNLNADPDPATQINADPCGSGSETLSRTLELTDLFLQIFYFRKMRVDFKSMEEEMDQLAGMLPSCTDHTFGLNSLS